MSQNAEYIQLKERIRELEKENEALKQQQIEITEAKELYLKIFEEFPALIWRSRLDMLCDYFNKTWLEFTGRTMEQEFGNGWAEGVHPEDFDFCLKTYTSAFEKRQPFYMEYRLKNKFGEYRWLRDFGRPFYDVDSTFLGYIGSCYDITDKINNELKLTELNATKDKFFSIIAHDLKSPFSSIVGFSELLTKVVENKEYEKVGTYTKVILESSSQAMDLLMNLMQWAQSQTGRIKFNPEKFDITGLIDEMLLLFKATAEQKSITITNLIPLVVYVNADKAMISTVLRNLISNAIKFTSPGGKINISITEGIISVSDNGVGISPERIDTLFQLDESYSTTGTQNEKGTGLGLILCKEFIEKHEGKFWVESLPASGSTFYFSLPLG